MAIRDARMDRARVAGNVEAERFYRKASQEWDMAGLARQDGDKIAEAKHTEQARDYEHTARMLME